MKKEVGINKHN